MGFFLRGRRKMERENEVNIERRKIFYIIQRRRKRTRKMRKHFG